MSHVKVQWRRHIVPELGLTLAFLIQPDVESLQLEGGLNIFQRLTPKDGILFLRYGLHETLTEFARTPADIITGVKVIEDQAITYCDHPARRVELVVTRQPFREHRFENGSIVHIDHLETRTLISVIGFEQKDIPVLVGYRILESQLVEFRTQLDGFVGSVSRI